MWSKPTFVCHASTSSFCESMESGPWSWRFVGYACRYTMPVDHGHRNTKRNNTLTTRPFFSIHWLHHVCSPYSSSIILCSRHIPWCGESTGLFELFSYAFGLSWPMACTHQVRAQLWHNRQHCQPNLLPHPLTTTDTYIELNLTLTPTHTYPYHTTATTSYHIISWLIFSWRNGDSGDSVEHEKILKNAATELIKIVEHQAAAYLTEPVKNLTEPHIMGELIRERDACLSLQQLRHLVNCVVIQGNFLPFYSSSNSSRILVT